MGIKINNKEYDWGEILIYSAIGYAAIKLLLAIFGSSDSDCIQHAMDEYGYTYEQAKQECQESKSESLEQ